MKTSDLDAIDGQGVWVHLPYEAGVGWAKVVETRVKEPHQGACMGFRAQAASQRQSGMSAAAELRQRPRHAPHQVFWAFRRRTARVTVRELSRRP